jgi:hypothetical protein
MLYWCLIRQNMFQSTYFNCLVKTSLRVRHTQCRQPNGRNVMCMFSEIAGMAILVSVICLK